MQPVIKPVDRKLIRHELTAAKYIRTTRKGDNELYEVTYKDSPNIMQEIGRLREISFRLAGGGSGKDCDIDQFDTDPVDYYRQLIVWDPHDKEILGGYRYILCGGIPPEKWRHGRYSVFRHIRPGLSAFHYRAWTFVHPAQLPEHQP